MPNNTTPTPKDQAAANAEVAAKQAAQDISGHSNKPEASPETGDALDALAKQMQEDREKEAYAEVVEKDETPKPAADATPVVDPAKQKAEEEAAAKKKAEDDALRQKSDTIFKDSPGLPAGASPKSAEAFATIKIRATQEISARDQKIADLEKKLADAEAKLKTPIPEEITKELDDLRTFRSRIDLDADPTFKEFDKKVENHREFIYSQLSKSPAVGTDTIAKIKELGGPENVNLDKLFEAINDPVMRRLVESKLADIEQLKWQKGQALKSAKDNIKQYLGEREKHYTEAVNQHRTATSKIFETLAKDKLTWLTEKQDEPNATEEQKKLNAAHNKFVADVKGYIKTATEDDSPDMRATMLAGMAQLLYLQNLYEAQSKRLATIESEHTAALEAKTKEITELNAKLERFTKASVSRLRESNAPSSGKLPEEKPKDNFTVPTTEALDRLARAKAEERNAA